MTKRKRKRGKSRRPAAHIGIDVTAALSQGAGIGRYTRELVRAVVQADRHSQFHLFHARVPASAVARHPLPQRRNVQRHPAPLSERWLYRIWYRFRLPLPVQSFTGPLDLFHSPDFVLPPVRQGIPTLLTVHDLSFVHYPETFTPALVSYLRRVVPWSVQRASHILADSEATRQDLLALWQVPAEKVTVLLSGVNASFQPVTGQARLAAMRQKYGLGHGPYLLTLSTIQPRKNVQMLIRAFRPVAQQWPHDLVIGGGKGWLYQSALDEVAAQGLAGRVHFIGFVDDQDLPALYSDATLFLFPSLYEGFGLPLLEAMACGLPVISSNVSSLPEVAGNAAILLPPTDTDAWTEAMNNLLAEPVRRVSLVSAGYFQARRFTWESAAGQLGELYRRLLTTGK